LAVEGGVRLALAIDQGADVVHQAGEVVLDALPPPTREGIEAPDAAVELMQGLAEGDAAPTQRALGEAEVAAEEANGTGHEEAAVEAAQRRSRLAQVVLDVVGEFHGDAFHDEREGHPTG
jgi:hypothetical protein